MPRKSAARDEAHKEEIINACALLYEKKGFHDMTIKDISAETSLSRPSIYNYFETKEEIFLGLLTRETKQWIASLEEIAQKPQMSKETLISEIAMALEKRVVMLKISAMNIYEIEDHSRIERLVEYKKVFKQSLDAFYNCLKKFMPDLTADRLEKIRYAFYPFMNGIYPYVYPTDKQLKAMSAADIRTASTSIHELTENFLEQILS